MGKHQSLARTGVFSVASTYLQLKSLEQVFLFVVLQKVKCYFYKNDKDFNGLFHNNKAVFFDILALSYDQLYFLSPQIIYTTVRKWCTIHFKFELA